MSDELTSEDMERLQVSLVDLPGLEITHLPILVDGKWIGVCDPAAGRCLRDGEEEVQRGKDGSYRVLRVVERPLSREAIQVSMRVHNVRQHVAWWIARLSGLRLTLPPDWGSNWNDGIPTWGVRPHRNEPGDHHLRLKFDAEQCPELADLSQRPRDERRLSDLSPWIDAAALAAAARYVGRSQSA